MGNETCVADHSRTIYGERIAKAVADPQNVEKGYERFGRHIVDYIGHDKPWSSWGRIAIEMFACGPTVYFIGGETGPIKIGFGSCPLKRLANFQIGSPVVLKIHALAKGGQAVERDYHARFAEHRLHGEWFEPAPAILSEIARLSPTPPETTDG